MKEELDPNGDPFNPNWVWEKAFERADSLMGFLNPIFTKEYDTQDHSLTEKLISQTMSIFLIACFLNQKILDEEYLDETLKAAKKMTKMFLENSNRILN